MDKYENMGASITSEIMCRNNKIVKTDYYSNPPKSGVPFRDKRAELGKSNEIA